MARTSERTRPGGKERHNVLERPEYIHGVTESKNESAKSSRNPEQCESVLDGPECIHGVTAPKRRKK